MASAASSTTSAAASISAVAVAPAKAAAGTVTTHTVGIASVATAIAATPAAPLPPISHLPPPAAAAGASPPTFGAAAAATAGAGRSGLPGAFGAVGEIGLSFLSGAKSFLEATSAPSSKPDGHTSALRTFARIFTTPGSDAGRKSVQERAAALAKVLDLSRDFLSDFMAIGLGEPCGCASDVEFRWNHGFSLQSLLIALRNAAISVRLAREANDERSLQFACISFLTALAQITRDGFPGFLGAPISGTMPPPPPTGAAAPARAMPAAAAAASADPALPTWETFVHLCTQHLFSASPPTSRSHPLREPIKEFWRSVTSIFKERATLSDEEVAKAGSDAVIKRFAIPAVNAMATFFEAVLSYAFPALPPYAPAPVDEMYS